MIRKLSSLLAIGLMAASLSSPGFAKGKPKITKAEATKAVKAAMPNGKIQSAEYEQEDGKSIWSFDVKDAGALHEVWVDSNTGAVIQNTVESKADQKAETKMDKAEAIVKRKTGGTVIGSSTEGTGANETYVFQVQMKDGSKKEVRINAKTHKIQK